MRTYRNNNWRQLDEKQKTAALLWLKLEAKPNVIYPCVTGLFLLSGAYAYMIFYRIKSGQSIISDITDITLLMLFLVIAAILISKIIRVILRIIAIRSDKALITEVTVVSKDIRLHGRMNRQFYYIKVMGLYEGGKMVNKEIRISKNLYSVVNVNDSGYAIRYDSAENKKLPDHLGFIPK